MHLYLAPSSSLQLIRYLRSVNGPDGIGGTLTRKRSLKDAVNSVRSLHELDATAQLWIEHAGSPVHAFVADRAKGTSTKHLVTHVLSQPLPYGAFLDLGHGICICSPNFMFLQLATQKGLLELVHTGMELCGTYSRWSLEPAQPLLSPDRDPENNNACTFQLPAATQVTRLESFIGRMDGQRGAVGARAAVRWLADGSASPMETATYLLLCLPKRLGGYGLPKPILNPQLTISNPDGVKVRYPDLFWLGPNIDVEYNSDKDHSGEWSRYRDSKREVELAVANVRVLPLTRPQLMDVDAFDAFANGLRRMLGIRTRSEDPQWKQRRAELREALLSSWAE